jgi:hypothetical protein
MDDTRINLLDTELDVDIIGHPKEEEDSCKFCNKYCITERCGVYMAALNVVFIGLLIIAIILGVLKLANKI